MITTQQHQDHLAEVAVFGEFTLADFKEFEVGGARISELHANIITTADGARASDVRALMEMIQEHIQLGSGIALEPEIEIFE